MIYQSEEVIGGKAAIRLYFISLIVVGQMLLVNLVLAAIISGLGAKTT